ncbi:SHOCT domain-containing protein [Halobaculum sp. CBA1158]|uniref:SHOCT domain-containing protein n=1 Tax=Halobaculum sp. CBA1158 TaxID=2904243 RepID=UPI001F2C6B46|nr:SHOCT domain-containing protein [Halobaculum sp. CBA1158]UIP00430.1 SHOCT domain-containing protein [Halobaculum sp. CBA1158]
MSDSPAERLRENATGIASTVVTGVWLAAWAMGWNWWLPALLFGYVVVVPVVAMLFGDEEDVEEWWDDETWESESADDSTDESTAAEDADGDADRGGDDALATLRDRYARGELTDDQFERKLDRLLESESLEDVEDRARRERRAADRERRETERE